MGSIEAAELRDVPLDRLFRPRRVAVIGASGTSGSGPRLLWRTVKRRVEQDGGEVYPVNPGRAELDGVRCYPQVGDIPGDLDLVVIAGGDPLVGLKQTAEKRPLFVMMFAAGFAESGPEGARAQDEIKAIVDTSGMHLLGPNTTLNSFLPLRHLPPPKVALVSHSGHQGRHVWEAEQAGMPLAYWAPTGNEVDLEVADFVKWFADQPEVGAISGYVEGFKDGATFRAAAAYARERRKPIVLVKVGRSPTGVANAQSHTAHVAGRDGVADGVFAQYGVVRVDTLDELTHTSHFLARSRPPLGPGVCVYSISGGTTAHLSDLVTAVGLDLHPLAEETQQRLQQWIPDRLRVSNPVDSGGAPTGDERGRLILEALVADPAVGVVVCPFVANAYHLSEALVRDAMAVADTTDKPICLIWGAPVDSAPVYQDVLIASRLHVFRTFGQCLTALRAYFRYHADIDRRASCETDTADSATLAGAGVPDAASALPAGAVLDEVAAKQMVRSFGIPTSRDVVARTPTEAVAAAESLGYPVVVKGISSEIVHKAGHGLVHLGVATSEGVFEACRAIDEVLSATGPQLLERYLVSAMEFGGLELALGMVRDAVFGPAVMVGLGGSLLEPLQDVAFRVPPFDASEARRMLSDLRCGEAVRSAAGPSLAAVVDAIMAVQRMVVHLDDRLAEVDINPLLVRPTGVMALDALVVGR